MVNIGWVDSEKESGSTFEIYKGSDLVTESNGLVCLHCKQVKCMCFVGLGITVIDVATGKQTSISRLACESEMRLERQRFTIACDSIYANYRGSLYLPPG